MAKRRSNWEPGDVEHRGLTCYEKWYQEPGFAMKGGVESVACDMVFRDYWSQACKANPDTERQRIEPMLYKEGWDGHWPTLVKQIHNYDVTLKNPILLKLWLLGGMFFLSWSRVARRKMQSYSAF